MYGPISYLTILGIELDSVNQVAQLPADKLLALQNLIVSWLPRKWCNRQELESLIGHLHHVAKVVWPGRTFLRRMIDLLCCFGKKDHPIRLNHEFHLDLQWWHQFLVQWHGMSFWLFPGLSPVADVVVSSDAAGSLGFGAYFKGQWFTGSWSLYQQHQSIAYKELFPVVVAAHVWGHRWCTKHFLFRSDNDSVVHMLNSRTSKVPCLMRLLRNMLLSAACHRFPFQPSMFRESITKLLMRCLVFISRTQTVGAGGIATPNTNPTSAVPDEFDISLEQQCSTFMLQGLASSTGKLYASAQAKFTSFCR